ncbi:MAG TPA: hypothetical protein ENG90_04995 [Gammaproteobacteria bacterium]|nr:MAG: hypothetical protein IEMM0001_1599 [bacterium]HDH15819.1 hypothetical protein [Gammaproteobacteria bacterium]
MKRVLIVPAAGRGTRLGYDKPKFFYPLCGKPLIDHVLDLHCRFVDEAVVVVSTDAFELAQEYFRSSELPVRIVIQGEPTGMLDAILEAGRAVREIRPERIWITWCDQVAIQAKTLDRMKRLEEKNDPPMIVPIIRKSSPYIHFDMDDKGQISRVLQRREGDEMPDTGNNDMGLFSMSLSAFQQLENSFSSSPELGGTTGERNFLPFIPWLAKREVVMPMSGTDEMETLGVNTPEDVRQLTLQLCGENY